MVFTKKSENFIMTILETFDSDFIIKDLILDSILFKKDYKPPYF